MGERKAEAQGARGEGLLGGKTTGPDQNERVMVDRRISLIFLEGCRRKASLKSKEAANWKEFVEAFGFSRVPLLRGTRGPAAR